MSHASNPPHRSQPDARFFGRRKGPALSARKQALLDDKLAPLSIDIAGAPAGRVDPRSFFSGPVSAVQLEIGFGKGEHLIAQAEANPGVGFIGCEPYINGVAGLLDQVVARGITNIRLYADDARHVLAALMDASLSRVYLIHPDPWPKTRHARRRFVYGRNIDDMSRLLEDGGEWRIGTDHPVYRTWTLVQMVNRDDFDWLADRPADWQSRPDDWVETRYETKALEGRATYLRYRRRPRS